LLAFGETSISVYNDDLPRKQPLRWATTQTSALVPTPGSSPARLGESQGSRMPPSEQWLRMVILYSRGVTRGAQFPGRQITAGGAEKS